MLAPIAFLLSLLSIYSVSLCLCGSFFSLRLRGKMCIMFRSTLRVAGAVHKNGPDKSEMEGAVESGGLARGGKVEQFDWRVGDGDVGPGQPIDKVA